MGIKSRISSCLIINKLRTKTKSRISRFCHANKDTVLEGKNKIGAVNLISSCVGLGTYIVSGELPNCKIGRFSSIGHNVKVLPSSHPIDFVSTFPGFYKTVNKDIFLTGSDIQIKEFQKCSSGEL